MGLSITLIFTHSCVVKIEKVFSICNTVCLRTSSIFDRFVGERDAKFAFVRLLEE